MLPDHNQAFLRLEHGTQRGTVLEPAELFGRSARNLSRTLEDHGLVKLLRSADTRD